MLVRQIVVDKDRVCIALFLEPFLHVADLILWYLQTGPAVPLVRHCFGEAAETGDQAARGHGEVVRAIISSLDGKWQTVGDDEQATTIVEAGVWHLDWTLRVCVV